jgi:hypothetical protein
VWATEAVTAEPRGRGERIVYAFVLPIVLAAAATKVLAQWAFRGFAPAWVVFAVALVPAGLAVVWLLTREYARASRLIAAAFAIVACLAVAWWSWVPAPASFAPVRASQSADSAVAERLMTEIPRATCRPVSTVDLGPLAALGRWTQVCADGIWNAANNKLSLRRPDGSALTYESDTRAWPGECSAHIVGGWWVSQPADDRNVQQPCPHGFRYVSEV